MYPIMNLGQDATQQQPQTPTANSTPRRAPDPGVCCQAVADGSIVCSDGIIYMPGCPKAPEPNVEGMAQVQNGIPVPPPSTACQAQMPAPAPAGATSGKFPILPVLGGILGGIGLATGAYFLLFKK